MWKYEEVCRNSGEVQDGAELSPLYSLWDLKKFRAVPPYRLRTWKNSELLRLYNYGLFT